MFKNSASHMVAFERRLAGESRVIRGLCSNHDVCDDRESCWMRKNSEPGGLGADISEATDHPVWQSLTVCASLSKCLKLCWFYRCKINKQKRSLSLMTSLGKV